MDIDVVKASEEPLKYAVGVLDGDTILGEYTVRVSPDEYAQYGNGAEPHELVEATLRFLLDRETPEMILERFSLSDVEKYFSDYPEKIVSYL